MLSKFVFIALLVCLFVCGCMYVCAFWEWQQNRIRFPLSPLPISPLHIPFILHTSYVIRSWGIHTCTCACAHAINGNNDNNNIHNQNIQFEFAFINKINIGEREHRAADGERAKKKLICLPDRREKISSWSTKSICHKERKKKNMRGPIRIIAIIVSIIMAFECQSRIYCWLLSCSHGQMNEWFTMFFSVLLSLWLWFIYIQSFYWRWPMGQAERCCLMTIAADDCESIGGALLMPFTSFSTVAFDRAASNSTVPVTLPRILIDPFIYA